MHTKVVMRCVAFRPVYHFLNSLTHNDTCINAILYMCNNINKAYTCICTMI